MNHIDYARRQSGVWNMVVTNEDDTPMVAGGGHIYGMASLHQKAQAMLLESCWILPICCSFLGGLCYQRIMQQFWNCMRRQSFERISYSLASPRDYRSPQALSYVMIYYDRKSVSNHVLSKALLHLILLCTYLLYCTAGTCTKRYTNTHAFESPRWISSSFYLTVEVQKSVLVIHFTKKI